MHVAEATLAALRHQQALAMPGQVADDLVGGDIGDLGADRHGDDQVIAALAVALAAHPVFAALGLEFPLVTEIDQRVEILVGQQPDAAAITAVAAIRPAERDELLATESHAAIAAIAGGDGDFDFIDELHGMLRPAEFMKV